MAVEGGSKPRLDSLLDRVQRSPVKRALAVLPIALLWAPAAFAQAPDWADLWRVASVTLASPAALERGPTGIFWNPAAVRDTRGLAGGFEVLQTSSAVNLGGLMGALTYRLGITSFGVTAGRVSVGDLVRTTSSPVSEEGAIPVYAQFFGVVAGMAAGPVKVGVQVRMHDARLDARTDDGLTLDFGVRLDSLGPFRLAAATHFTAPGFDSHPTTDYYGAAEIRLGTSRVWGAPAVLSGRYGVDIHATGGIEQGVSAGVAFGDRLRVDAGFQREVAYDLAAWRFAMGLAFRAGRYLIAASRGSGINDVGAAYRIGLSAGVLR
jgi:hypothetical protein